MSECYCDYDAPEFAECRDIKAARKPHRCTECGRPILIGEPYEYTSGKWEGYFNDFHVCTDCQELRKWMLESVPCFCWSYGGLLEDAANTVEEYRRDIPGFFFEYGRRIVKIRQKAAALKSRAIQGEQ